VIDTSGTGLKGIAPALIIAIGAALAIVFIGTSIAYRISKGDWGPAGGLVWGPVLLIGAGIAALVVMKGGLKGRLKGRS